VNWQELLGVRQELGEDKKKGQKIIIIFGLKFFDLINRVIALTDEFILVI